MLNLNIMLSNFFATLRHKSWFFSKQLLKWKMELLIKTKTCIWRLIFTLTKHPFCHLSQCFHYIETSQLIYGANRWDGFYIMATLDWNKLILTTTFSIYYFFLSWRNPLSPSVQLTRHIFHKSIKPRMQTENLASNSHK